MIIFLQDLISLARKLSYNFSCKFFTRFFVSCKKSFIFSARLARYVQVLMQKIASLARKILARPEYFLQEGFYWDFSKVDTLESI